MDLLQAAFDTLMRRFSGSAPGSKRRSRPSGPLLLEYGDVHGARRLLLVACRRCDRRVRVRPDRVEEISKMSKFKHQKRLKQKR
jgi:hypothetical protein